MIDGCIKINVVNRVIKRFFGKSISGFILYKIKTSFIVLESYNNTVSCFLGNLQTLYSIFRIVTFNTFILGKDLEQKKSDFC